MCQLPFYFCLFNYSVILDSTKQKKYMADSKVDKEGILDCYKHDQCSWATSGDNEDKTSPLLDEWHAPR